MGHLGRAPNSHAMGMPATYDGTEQLSPNYKLSDFCVTSTGLVNLPTDTQTFSNLVQLANLKEALDAGIGPSTILSGFRTPEVQAALAAAGEPVPPQGNLSFHEVGLALDIAPTTMSLDDYFRNMVLNFRDQVAEMAYKPSQNSIHFAAVVPYKQGVVLTLNPNTNTYGKLSEQDIQDFLGNSASSVADVSADATPDGLSTSSSDNIVAAGAGSLSGSAGVILLGLAALAALFMGGKKKA